MVSAFQSRAFGFGMPCLADDELDEVNKYREGKKYADEDAAMAVLGTAEKGDLTSDPLVREFSYGQGAGKQGYWDYNHMVLQMEDVVDVLEVMYPNNDICFLFDHSSGHTKGRPDGLCVNDMNKGWGKDQPIPRDSEIVEGCLGKHSPTLKIGDVQRFHFTADDDGPIGMSPAERQRLKFTERVVEGAPLEKHDFNVKDLKAKLTAKKIRIPPGSKKADIHKLCSECGIAVTEERVKKEYGWLGKAKGLKQICLERGLLNPKKKYQVHAPKDAFGNKDDSLSLRYLLSSCTDFINETGQLAFIAAKLGVEIDFSPKCHPELAGEGIE